jgi:membrane protein implicated in regulation of membrane protease activity
MAGALIILAGGLTLMIATLPGSVALMAAAAAFAVLAPTMALLGKMSWETIFKGLGAMALALGHDRRGGARRSSGSGGYRHRA